LTVEGVSGFAVYGSEAGSYLKLIDLYHSTLGLRVIKKKKVEGWDAHSCRA